MAQILRHRTGYEGVSQCKGGSPLALARRCGGQAHLGQLPEAAALPLLLLQPVLHLGRGVRLHPVLTH